MYEELRHAHNAQIVVIREETHGFLVMSDEEGNLKLIETSQLHIPPRECMFKMNVNGRQITSLTDYKGRVCSYKPEKLEEIHRPKQERLVGKVVRFGTLNRILRSFGVPPALWVGAVTDSASEVPPQSPSYRKVEDAAFRFIGKDISEPWQPCILDICDDFGSRQSVNTNISFSKGQKKTFWQAKIESSYGPYHGDPKFNDKGSIIPAHSPCDDSMIFRIEAFLYEAQAFCPN